MTRWYSKRYGASSIRDLWHKTAVFTINVAEFETKLQGSIHKPDEA